MDEDKLGALVQNWAENTFRIVENKTVNFFILMGLYTINNKHLYVYDNRWYIIMTDGTLSTAPEHFAICFTNADHIITI